MGLFASPILILIDQRFVPAPILLATWVLTTFLILRERHAIDIQGLRWAVSGRLLGTLLAATILASLPGDWMELVFGGLVLLGVAISGSSLRLEPRREVLLGAGILSALMGTIASIGGPPMAPVYQDAPGSRLRSTMSSFFWVGTVVSLLALRLVGRFGQEEIKLTLVILPGVLLGLWASSWTSPVIDRGYTRAAVLSLAAAAALAVITRQFV